MPYADAFTGGIIAPANLTYLSLEISTDVTLSWPIEQAVAGDDIVAEIIDVDASGPGLNVNLPDARQVSQGYTALFNNVGGQTVTVRDSAAGTLVSLASGTVWQLYLIDNTTSAGTWRVFQFGASVSVTNAAALAGAGLKAISTTLNLQLTTISSAVSPITVVDSNRAQVLRWTGAAGVLNLPAVGTVGADFFIMVRNDGSGDLTVTPAAGTIDGAATKTFPAGSSAFVVSDGTNWYTLGFGSGAGGAGGGFDFLEIDVSGSGNFVLSGVQLNRIGYRFIGVLTGDRSIIVPNAIQEYWVTNGTTGAFNLFIKTAAQVTPVQILANNSGITFCDGNNVIDAESSTVSFPITVALGGTGANNASTARTNLGVAYANPTGLVGPVAVNGATGNVMDAGSAPALNLTVAYSWSATSNHTFAFPISGLNWPILISSADPGILLRETDAASDNQYVGVRLVGEQVRLQLIDNAGVAVTFGTVDRTGNVCDLIAWAGTAFTVTATTITLSGTTVANGNAQPNADNSRSLGLAATRWASTFSVIYSLGTNKEALTDVGNVLTIGSGSAWTGVNIANGTFTVNGVSIALSSFTVNSQSGNYTAVLADANQLILHPSGAGAGDTLTIPANASVAYPIGTTLTFVNRDSNTVTIAITSDTLVLSGGTTTGSRTLTQNGVATAIKIESTVWLISGVGLG